MVAKIQGLEDLGAIVNRAVLIIFKMPIVGLSLKSQGQSKGLLDTNMANSYNNLYAEVAQSVEQRTENPRVPSSILGLGTKVKAEVVQR